MFADFLGFELQQILAGPAQHARRSFRSTGRMYARPVPRINLPGLSAAGVGSDLPLPVALRGASDKSSLDCSSISVIRISTFWTKTMISNLYVRISPTLVRSGVRTA